MSDLVLFGGQDASNTALNDTWTWNGTTWTQANPSTSPPARGAAAMAENGSNEVVLFGGQSTSGSALGDTWIWNGTTWTQANPSTSPPARYLASMAYDSSAGVDLLFGGANTSALGDSWIASSLIGVSTSLESSASTVGFGTSVTLTASLTPAAGPTGTVTFTDTANGQSSTLGTQSVSSGAATYSGALPAVGVNAITATYSGDGSYQGSTSNTVLVTVAPTSGLGLITQLRFSGPGGAPDGYVDVENSSTTMSLPLAGWRVVAVKADGTSTTLTAPLNVTIPPGGAYLLAGSAYSLGSVATPDDTTLPANVVGVQVLPPDGFPPTDAVGYPVVSGYYGGSGLTYLSGNPTDQYAFVRTGSQAKPTNTGNNSSDFELVSTDAASFALSGGGSAQSVLGSPSPLSSTSPRQSNVTLQSTLVVPSAGQNGCPNRMITPASGNRPETLVFNRTVTNTTGKDVTGLWFRITSITQQYGPPAGSHAWLTVVSSPDPTITTCGSSNYTVDGLSLNAPTGSSGGGLGTTLSPSEVSVANPLPPGATISVSFMFDVSQGGSYSVGYDVDATTS